jgi:hypothetical protein
MVGHDTVQFRASGSVSELDNILKRIHTVFFVGFVDAVRAVSHLANIAQPDARTLRGRGPDDQSLRGEAMVRHSTVHYDWHPRCPQLHAIGQLHENERRKTVTHLVL